MTEQTTDTEQTVRPGEQLQAAADQARAYGLEQVALGFEMFFEKWTEVETESTAHSSAD